MGQEQSSTRELIAEVLNSGDATERELILIDRLQNALDEVDLLHAALNRQEKAVSSVPRQIENTYRMAQRFPAVVVTSVRNGIIAMLGAAALVAGTAVGSGVAESIRDEIFAYYDEPVAFDR